MDANLIKVGDLCEVWGSRHQLSANANLKAQYDFDIMAEANGYFGTHNPIPPRLVRDRFSIEEIEYGHYGTKWFVKRLVGKSKYTDDIKDLTPYIEDILIVQNDITDTK